ncbi:MAG: ArsR/SmtB family transcription factor [Nocardioidaceae bacterium]
MGELAAPYAVTVQAVSKHIKVLEETGLVSRSRDAQRRPCHLEAEVFDLMTKWIERYRRQAEERFARSTKCSPRWSRPRIPREGEQHHERNHQPCGTNGASLSAALGRNRPE